LVSSIDSPARRAPAGRAPRPGKAADAGRAARLGRYARVAFLIPAFAYVLVAFVVPVVYNLILSFELTSPATIASLFAPFAGLANYRATLLQPVTQSVIVRTKTNYLVQTDYRARIGRSGNFRDIYAIDVRRRGVRRVLHSVGDSLEVRAAADARSQTDGAASQSRYRLSETQRLVELNFDLQPRGIDEE